MRLPTIGAVSLYVSDRMSSMSLVFSTREKNLLVFVPKLLVLGLLALVSVGCVRSDGEVGLGPGNAPPDLKLPLLSDPSREISLRDFKGKAVLLNFWASWCAPCVAEMPELEQLHAALASSGFSVVAIGVDDAPENLERVRKRFNLTFPILVDRKGASKNAYKLSGFPESFAIGKDGALTMVPDPDGSQPVVRFVGPREWSKEPALSLLRALATH